MLQRISLLAAAALTSLAVPVVAGAKLPATKTKTIVFGKSVAGAKLGMSLSSAKSRWGRGGRCSAAATDRPATQCVWSTTPGKRPDTGAKLVLVAVGGKVRAITVTKGTGGSTKGITAFRTKDNIGVGSTVNAVRKAYPKLGRLSGSPSGASAELGSGRTRTSLFFVDGKLDSIQIGTP